MPFDPSLPLPNSPLESRVIRDQLQALFNLINNIGAVNAAQVDAVNTTDPGNPALAGVSVVGDTLHFTFTLPRGNDGQPGMPGQPGNNGSDGGPGPAGPQGPPFAQAIIDAVNTLNPGENATVSMTFDGSNVRFTFGIPRGADGAPGEVSAAQLTDAISGTSSNSNAVPTMDTPFTNDPPSLADIEAMRAKYNELVLALRRP